VVVLVGLVLLTFMTLRVGEYRFGEEEGYRIFALLDTVAGLEVNGSVRVAGVEVGKIESIELLDSRARVTLRIRPEIQIRKGAKAAVRAVGLLGDKFLEIVPGGETGLLADQDVIEQRAVSADLDRVLEQVSSIADDIKAVSGSLREAMGTEEGKQSLKEIVANIRDLTRNLNETVKQNQANIEKAIANIKDFSGFLKDELPKLFKEDLPRLLDTLNRVAAKLEKGEGTLGKLLTDEGVYNKLDAALGSLKGISEKLEKGEGTIGKLLTDDKAYESLTSTLQGLGGAVSRIEKLKVFVGFRNEYELADRQDDEAHGNKGYFSLQLKPREDKYYLVEIVDDPRGRVRRTVTTDQVTGVTSDVLEIERQLKFSALFAKRFGDLDLRIGLMENTFGLGADYLFLNDAVRLSLDAWDFNSDDPLNPQARLKATARYDPFKYVFLQAGYDNFLNEEIDTGFVGGGLRFEDDDLKYLLGGAASFLR
jgi:phospholipid/cholesterol/gamma-HCH transport system substrate-binding protein